MILKLGIAIVFIVIVSIIAAIINLLLTPQNVKHNISFRSSLDLTDLPIITFYQKGLNDKVTKVNFLLDTGANISVINTNALSFVNYKPIEKEGNLYGNTGVISSCSFIEMHFYHKDQNYIDELQVSDMSVALGHLKADTGVEVHGIIGTNFFQKYKYVLDFKELEVKQLK